MSDIVITAAKRTPVGSFLGAFSTTPAHVLGQTAIVAALEQAGVSAEEVNEVILGHVLTAGLGQNPARQAAVGAGVPVDIRTSEGESLLMLATANDHTQTVEVLLEQGANPNLADNQGQTPLMVAAGNNSVHLIEPLLAAGAKPELTDTKGATALDHARAAGAESAIARLSA